jgi:hypothetical protein
VVDSGGGFFGMAKASVTILDKNAKDKVRTGFCGVMSVAVRVLWLGFRGWSVAVRVLWLGFRGFRGWSGKIVGNREEWDARPT